MKSSKNTKKNVVVTGGAGFIGSHLVHALVKEDLNVFVIDNLYSGKKENLPKEAKLIEGDIRKAEEIQKIFASLGEIECVFHLAAIPQVQFSIENPLETNETNAVGTCNVLQASKLAKAKQFILSSSASVYGTPDIVPTSETALVHPLSPYAVQKHVGERYCQLYNLIYDLPTVCLRYFNVYGPGQPDTGTYASVISLFLKLRKEGKKLTITGDGKQTRDFVHVFDVVQANIQAMKMGQKNRGEIINIASGTEETVNEIADMIGGEKEYIAPRIEPRRSLADISKAKKLLDWQPKMTLQKGITELKKHHGIK